MVSTKVTGLFKKFLNARQSDNDPLLATNEDQQQPQSLDKNFLASKEALNSCRLPSSNIACCVNDKYKDSGMCGDSLSPFRCNETGCAQFKGTECAACQGVLPSELAAYPTDYASSTIVSSTASSDLAAPPDCPEPLCCCESCSWWIDSYPCLPSRTLPKSASVQRHTQCSEPRVILHNTGHNRQLGKSSRQRTYRITSNNQTSLANESKASPNGHNLVERSKLGQAARDLPVNVIASLDGEEGYTVMQQLLRRSNRLRHNVTSYTFEVSKSSVTAPPNKSICHVVR